MITDGILTKEIRWFDTGPNLLEDIWKEITGPLVTPSAERTDLYLLTGQKNAGIKIREGRQEIKVKCAPDLSRQVGRVETWIKWSYAAEPKFEEIIPEDLRHEWLPVTKRRQLLYFGPDTKSGVMMHRLAFPGIGFQIEYTELLCPTVEKVFYTLGIEAFGSAQHQLEWLDQGLLLLQKHNTVLAGIPSCGYAEWLVGKQT